MNALLISLLLASDWTQWRGANRDGVVAEAPKTWPEKLTRKWQVTIGEGHASPIFANGRIYAFARKDKRESIYALDPASGKILWEQAYDAPYQPTPVAAGHGPGPKSTPLFQDGKVCTLGISGVLTCVDAASGRLLWRKETNRAPEFGTAMSPVVDRGLLIAHVGGNGSGALTAFDLATGAVKWAWTGDGPAYASPIVVELNGARQVVTQTQSNIVSVSASTGELLWKLPYKTEYEQNIVTPVAYKDTLIVSGVSKSTQALRGTATVWENRDAPMYMSSPVLKGDYLFGMTHRNRGQFFCLDARTGKTVWSGPPRQADNAAIELAGDYLALLKSDGELVIARATEKGWEPVRAYTVADSPTYAHPLITPRGVVIKDKLTLAYWE